MTPREIQAFPSNLLVDGFGRFFGYSPEDLRKLFVWAGFLTGRLGERACT